MPLALVADSLKVLNSDLWSFGSYLLATDGDEKNFEHVLDLVEEASEGLMAFVIKKVDGHD